MEITDLDPVVQRPISTSPGLNFSSGFFFVCSKAFPKILFPQLFLEHSINKLYAKRIKLNVLFKLLYLHSNFALTLGYLNPGLNKLALIMMAYTMQMSPGFSIFWWRLSETDYHYVPYNKLASWRKMNFSHNSNMYLKCRCSSWFDWFICFCHIYRLYNTKKDGDGEAWIGRQPGQACMSLVPLMQPFCL